MRVAHAKVTGKRDSQTGTRYKALLDDPGVVHAIDAAGTWDGDPWRGREAPGDAHFYDVGGPYAACGVKVRAVLGDRFDPKDGDRALCPRCAELVAGGKGFRTPPHERRSYFCEAYVRLKVGGRVIVGEVPPARLPRRQAPDVRRSDLGARGRGLRSGAARLSAPRRGSSACIASPRPLAHRHVRKSRCPTRDDE